MSAPRDGGRPWRSEGAVVVSCEHGGHEVPAEYADLFEGAEEVLESHRGWDRGALGLARTLALELSASLHVATVTRLLVDLNRSPHNRSVLSEYTRPLSFRERRALLDRHHVPHRTRVARDVARGVEERGAVLHLSVHTFTPVLDGRVRRADLGILYDPARPGERALAKVWVASLSELLPGMTVRRNDPYRGSADGLVTWLRRMHGPDDYVGLEIEVNQRLLDEAGEVPGEIARALVEGLARALASVLEEEAPDARSSMP